MASAMMRLGLSREHAARRSILHFLQCSGIGCTVHTHRMIMRYCDVALLHFQIGDGGASTLR